MYPEASTPAVRLPLRPRILSLCLLVLPGLATPLAADWVTLKNGRHLRGIDLEKSGRAYRFTLENGKAIYLGTDDVFYLEKSPAGEKVEFRGKKVTLRQKIKTLRKESRARSERSLRRVETAARGDKSTEKVREELAALPAAERSEVLARLLRESRVTEARRLAARELARLASTGQEASNAEPPAAPAAPAIAEPRAGKRELAFELARAAIRDPIRTVRKASLAALEKVGHADTGTFFIPALRSKSALQRTRAAQALSRFPDRRAAGELVQVLRYTWSAFNRGYFLQATQRAYIADYELVSGGTGFAIIEVADPVVRTSTTGVVLDVHVQRVEMKAYVRALKKITGQDFGGDVKRWSRWLKENPAD